MTCALFLQGIKAYAGTRSRDETLRIQSGLDGSGSRVLQVKLVLRPAATLSFYRSPGLLLLCGQKRLLLTYTKKDIALNAYTGLNTWPLGYDIPASTSSAESLAWAMDQLQKCERHRICNSGGSTMLPNRVLCISEQDYRNVRLLTTNGTVTGVYACLSHCWGSDPERIPKTLKSTLRSYKDQIPWQLLSKKFQQTIEFLSKIGIRYLWIDSLCIVQDDPLNWQTEGAKMESIYANAHLTIAAAYSSHPDEGIYSTSTTTKFKAQELILDGNTNSGLFCRPSIEHVHHETSAYNPMDDLFYFLLADKYDEKKPTDEFPLLRRAWVLQERFLSPRTLYFGTNELLWECLEHRSCQCAESMDFSEPQGQILDGKVVEVVISEELKCAVNPKRSYSPTALQLLNAENGPEAVVKKWLALVDEYSTLQMTYLKDVFPALSGLAKAFRKILQTGYHGGLWCNFLTMGLLWKAKVVNNRPKIWRAPSWCWASVNSPVSHFLANKLDGKLEDLCHVLRVSCTPAGADPTGEIQEGHVVLQGFVVETELQYKPGRKTNWDIFDIDFMHQKGGNVYADYDTYNSVPAGTQIVCFLVAKTVPQNDYMFLILRRTGQSSDNAGYIEYERIGMMELYERQNGLKDVFDEYIRPRSKDAVVMIV